MPVILLMPLLLAGCSSTPTPAKVDTKPAPSAKKQDKQKTDHLIEDVQDAPTYGDKMLRTYQGAKDVKKQIDQQTAEQKDLQKSAD